MREASVREMNGESANAGVTEPQFPLEKFHPAFQRALLLEAQANDLLSYTTGRIPYWGLIRLATVFRLRDHALRESNTRDIYLKPRRFSASKVVPYVFDSLRRTPFLYTNRDVVFLCSGTNRLRQDGGFFNSRVDYFAQALSEHRPLLVEGADALRYAWPRVTEPVSSKGGLTVPAALWAQIGRIRSGEGRRIREFLAMVRETCGEWLDRSDCDFLDGYLRRVIVRSRAMYSLNARLLDRLKPRVIFVENAHCCLDLEMVFAARERKVTVVEYQHGAISPFCPHHNFHPHFLDSGFASYLPDHFLSYGDFWNDFLTTSSEIVSIGNPYLSDRASRLPKTEPRKNSVYFLSSADPPEGYIEQMRELLNEGFSVTFRPHPVERALLRERYGTFFQQANVEVDLDDDFYSSLPRYEHVLGDGRSTSVFEAFAIVGNRLRVLRANGGQGDTLPNHNFLLSIDSVRRLRHCDAEKRASQVSVEEVFSPDWRERFERFMQGILR